MQKVRFIFLTLISCMILGLTTDFVSTTAHAQSKVEHSALTVVDNGVLYYVHTASRREKLTDIADTYGVTVRAIREANPGVTTILKRKETVMIPTRVLQDQAKKEAEELKRQQQLELEQRVTVDDVLGSNEIVDEYFSGENLEHAELIDEALIQVEYGLTADVSKFGTLKVALLLPFMEQARSSDANFVEFYRGVLMAFEGLSKEYNRELDLEVISTGNSATKVEQLIREGRLDDKNLIIGPIYAEEFEVAARYATLKRIPIISPLGSVGDSNYPFVIEVAPQAENKWDEVVPLIENTDANVIVIEHQSLKDNATMGELSANIPVMAKRIAYRDKNTSVEILAEALDLNRENVIVVPISNEIAVEEILTRYSSINAIGRYNIRVIGTSRWARYERLNLDLFYKLNVTYPTTYYFDRMDSGGADFYGDYVDRFRSLPSLYVYRGYDVGEIFGRLLITRGNKMMYGVTVALRGALQTPYSFVRSTKELGNGKVVNNGRMVNTSWATVQYMRNYSVEVQ